jgi:hypothetical protein
MDAKKMQILYTIINQRPYISELMEDEDESVEREVRKWVKQIEKVLGERLVIRTINF